MKKTLLSAVMMFIATFMLAKTAQSQTPIDGTGSPVVLNGQAAMEYLASGVTDTAFFRGYYHCNLEKQGERTRLEYSDLKVKGGKIVFQKIFEEVICDVERGDVPLDGLLPPANGWVRTGFTLYITGFTAENKQTVGGNSGDPKMLKPGQNIIVRLDPRAMMRSIPRVQLGVPAFYAVSMAWNEGWGYYNQYTDSYELWVLPFLSGAPVYQIIDPATGIVYRTGTVPYLPDDMISLGTSSAIGTELRPGLRLVEFNQWGNANYQDQHLDGFTSSTAGIVSAETYLLDVGETKALLVQHGNLTDAHVIITDYDTGEVIFSRVQLSANLDNFWNVLIPGFGKVYVTVTGTIRADSRGFWIDFQKRDNVPDLPLEDGGGKG